MSDFRTLLPPNATPAMRAVERTTAEPKEGLSGPIGQLWNVDTCPEALLPLMAWAFSVEVWDAAWPEMRKRQVIRSSIEVHRLKGTRGAVERALEAIGTPATIREWWETGGAPHTFNIELDVTAYVQEGSVFDSALLNRLGAAVDAAKPVRSQYDITASYSVSAGPAIGGASFTTIMVEVFPT